MKNVKSLLSIAIVIALGVGLLFGVNGITAPVIAANSSSAAFAPLLSVMPEAGDFEVLYDAQDAASSALTDVPAAVTNIYKESSGLGYVVRMSTSEGYTKKPIVLTMAVDAEGKISGIELNESEETKPMGDDYIPTYLGQDSTLADVGLVSGVTFSSSAFKGAVSAGFEALVANELIGAGVKSSAQIFMEILPAHFSGIANPSGIAQYEELEPTGSASVAMKALNGSGAAAILSDGSSEVLGIGSVLGGVKLVSVDGEDVTAQFPALADEVKALVADNCEATAESDARKTALLAPEGAELTPVELPDTFSCVTSAYTVSAGGETMYAFVARPYGYSNDLMVVYYVLDESGAIVSMKADEFILYSEYFSEYTLDEDAYKAGFTGVTTDSFSDELAVISGATMSSDAVKSATNAVFEAFEAIK